MAKSKLASPAQLNAHGELELVLEGVTYVLRPSREAIEAAERQTGQSLMLLGQAAREGRLTLDDVAILVAEFCRAWGREAGPDDDPNHLAARDFKASDSLKDMLFEAGLTQINARLAVVLSGALTGGYDARGKAKAAWAAVLAAGTGKKTQPAA